MPLLRSASADQQAQAVSPEAAAALQDSSAQAHVVIDHPAYQAWTAVSPDLRQELLRILGG